MNFKELQERAKGRNFDQITVVSRDIFQELANLSLVFPVAPGKVRTETEQNHPGLTVGKQEITYTQMCTTIYYQNTSLQVVQPVEGDTIYQRYLDRFGEGICCVRERIPGQMWDTTLAKLESKEINIAQRMESPVCKAAWVDLTDTLGILFEIITGESETPDPNYVVPMRIAQINITTPDVRKTIETITDLLEIGPWEVGCQNNKTVVDPGFRVDGRLQNVDFSFLVAILVCGNIEWEAIQPVKGPLVYFDFLKEHGIGYHHILREIPEKQWESTLQDYERAGVELSCQGKVGPVSWCYMNTKDKLGFFMELRTDSAMTKLPDGYLQYFYPEQTRD